MAVGVKRPCEVPIRIFATSLDCFPVRPRFGGLDLLLHAFTAIKFKPVKPHK
jgi:hypothetical protein